MPLIVPSQVVKIIEDFYPWAKNFAPGSGGDLPPTLHTSRMMGIAALIEEIPAELLNLSAADYGALLIAKRDIERVTATNLARGGNEYFPFTVPVDLWQVLSKCPDEFPPTSSTADLAFIPDVGLRDSIRHDIAAADRAFANVEWKASTVLAGSAIEALLLWAIASGPKANVGAASASVLAAGLRQPHADVNRWDLSEYSAGAAALGIITPDALKATNLARDFRNLIHPGKAARLNQICDRGTAHTALGALDHVVRDLS